MIPKYAILLIFVIYICLLEDSGYDDRAKLNVLRRSLRSPAAEVLTHLSKSHTAFDILDKMNSIYGDTSSGPSLLQKFYSSKQQVNESVAEWACKLEEIIYQIKSKQTMRGSAVEEMLINQFWTGLDNSRIKDALRQRMKAVDFQSLLVEARELEDEFKVEKTPCTSKPQQSSSEMASILEWIKKIDKRLEKVEKAGADSKGQHNTPAKTQQKSPVTCTQCQEAGHLSFGCRQGTEISCFKCGKQGHVARSCRPLN